MRRRNTLIPRIISRSATILTPIANRCDSHVAGILAWSSTPLLVKEDFVLMTAITRLHPRKGVNGPGAKALIQAQS
jgi:hypothetical protein